MSSATFEFNQQLAPQSLIDIDEVGNFALEAWNDEGYYWYLIIKTCLGLSAVASCGPVIPDFDTVPSGYSSSYDTIPYKEDKLNKTINFWLNDKSKKLIDAHVISTEEALSQFKSVADAIESYQGDI